MTWKASAEQCPSHTTARPVTANQEVCCEAFGHTLVVRGNSDLILRIRKASEVVLPEYSGFWILLEFFIDDLSHLVNWHGDVSIRIRRIEGTLNTCEVVASNLAPTKIVELQASLSDRIQDTCSTEDPE